MTVEIKGMGKINATKEVLNEIAIAFSNSCEYNAQKGYYYLAKEAEEAFLTIHKELDKVGYYK